MRLIRIVIPPLMFFTIAAVASIVNLHKLVMILAWMLILYVLTSVLAATWGILAGFLFEPGAGVGLEPSPGYKLPTPPTGVDIVLSFFQLDFSALLTVGGAMTMIIFATILGVAVVLLSEEGRRIHFILALGSRTMIGAIRVIMYYAPVAVLG